MQVCHTLGSSLDSCDGWESTCVSGASWNSATQIIDIKLFVCFFLVYFFRKNHYAPVSQANWCNMTFTAGNLFPCHSCIRWPESSPHQAPIGIRTGSPVWEADDLPTELSLPPTLNLTEHSYRIPVHPNSLNTMITPYWCCIVCMSEW